MDLKLLKRFLGPVKTPILIVGGIWLLAGIILTIVEFIVVNINGGAPVPTFVAWTILYPGRIALPCGLIYLIILVSLKMKAHYLWCKNDIYKEEHSIPRDCRRGYEHRMYHTIGHDCPCMQ